MYKDKTVGVVVPTYNEEGFVGDVIETMPEFVDRVYVVDDASTDGSWDEILEYTSQANSIASPIPDGGTVRRPRIIPIQHNTNQGVGGAIKTGYFRSLDDGIDVTAVMAGDGQMDPRFLKSILDPVVDGLADYAKANRLLYREYRQGMSQWRFFGNSVLTLLTKIASGYWKMMDPQNGYTAVSRRALELLDLETLYDDYGFSNDILVKLNTKRMRVADVAVPAKYGDETSYIRYRKFIPKTSWLLLRNFLWRLNTRYLVVDFHPLVLFYYFGALITVIGFAGGLWMVSSAVVFGGAILPGVLSGLLLFALGVMFLLFAMVFDMLANEDLELRVYDSE